MTHREDWSVYEVTDADEPGDAVLVGMRHCDFGGVTLLLVRGEGGWMLTSESDSPVRPMLLFYRGESPSEIAVRTWLTELGLDGERGQETPVPKTLDDPSLRNTVTRSIAAHLNYPPYPWLDEAALGMEMGRHFDGVDMVDWAEPTEVAPGSYTFRFFRRNSDASHDDAEIAATDLPF